ncbi:hypothetical protein VNO80_06785 [Phaseolus coccineus]|uniref:Uncharacterized protein n=1 Tax=Phaseolus coccineus TaxID=3886 RepID=A0AAN9NHH1_PHACN
MRVQNSQGVCSASPLPALNDEVPALNDEVVSVNPVYVKAGVASHNEAKAIFFMVLKYWLSQPTKGLKQERQ